MTDPTPADFPLPLEEVTPIGWNEGWTERWQAMKSVKGCLPARVWLSHGRYVDVWAGERDLAAYTSGRVMKTLQHHGGLTPVVGDWVAIEDPGPNPAPGHRAPIVAVLPRRTSLIRRSVERGIPQVLAANVDIMVVVTAPTGDVNLRRIERYLIMAREGGVQPMVVLNKIDLDRNWREVMEQIRSVSGDAPVLGISAERRRGLTELLTHLTPRSTFALVGSSGVGKSSIINSLAKDEWVQTGEIRESDGKGRHTTSRREMILMPNGSMLVDTPGIRELLPYEDGTDNGQGAEAFADIQELALTCRFRNCGHGGEPDCAVQLAVEQGTLDGQRLANWHRIRAEMAAAAQHTKGAPVSGRPQRHSAVTTNRAGGTKPKSGS
jgi:ribosome biogenesis GTPase